MAQDSAFIRALKAAILNAPMSTNAELARKFKIKPSTVRQVRAEMGVYSPNSSYAMNAERSNHDRAS